MIPQNMLIAKATQLIARILAEEYQGVVFKLKELVLINLENNQVLNPQYSCRQLDIINGAKLMLI
jgi:hypothetical protein